MATAQSGSKRVPRIFYPGILLFSMLELNMINLSWEDSLISESQVNPARFLPIFYPIGKKSAVAVLLNKSGDILNEEIKIIHKR